MWSSSHNYADSVPTIRANYFGFLAGAATPMREHVLLFCLLGLVLTATILLVTAPGAVTWALALIE